MAKKSDRKYTCTIIINSAKCKICNDHITSKNADTTCKCGNITIGGGIESLIRSKELDDSWEETSLISKNLI